MKKILIINGPNLNLLGKREPEIYGEKTLKDIETECKKESKKNRIEVSFFQSNSEGEIIEKLTLICLLWSILFSIIPVRSLSTYSKTRKKELKSLAWTTQWSLTHGQDIQTSCVYRLSQ